ncbi:MAG: hypothetical protein QG654_242 [Patescibacteria group bacterium]|nr:hypothetical protein [Patescibacteria group bacterium]
MKREQILLEWEAFEYKEKKRKPDWFWALGIIAIAGSTVAFIYGNFLFGIFIILTAVAMFFFGTTKPQRIKYRITTDGIIFDGRLYPYERLKSFWMEELDNEKRLLIRSDKTFMPIMVLPFEEDETGEDIYTIFSQILEEEEIQESFAHKIMDRLGF